MHEMTAEATREQLGRWIEEGQRLMALLPGLLEENDQLRGAVAAAEKEREGVDRELEHVKAENHALRGELTEIQDAFSRFMNDIEQLKNDIDQKLSAMQRRNLFTVER